MAWFVKHLIFPIHESFFGRKTFQVLGELERTQWYTPYQLQQYQLKKLCALLTQAHRCVPYYRKMLATLKLDPMDRKMFEDLKALPLLTKQIIRNNLSELQAKPFKHRLIRMNTGGSTGEPLVFYVDKRRQAYDKAAAFRAKQWWGINVGDKEIALWGAPVELSRQDRWKELRDRLINTKLLSAFSMDEDTMRSYAHIIHEYRPKHIFGYPSSIYLLSEFVKKNYLDMRGVGVKVIFVTGEVLYEHQRKLIQEAFGCPVANGYGGRDGGFIAHECPKGRMHITEDIYVEIIKDDKPVADGESGEIVITHFDNYAMPFIRYCMGDIGRISREKCPCGRNSVILEAIEGRSTDFIVTPEGKTMHGLSLIYVLRDLEGIEQFRIIQKKRDFLEVQVVKNHKYSPATENTARRGIQEKMGASVTVNFDYLPAIDAAASGKFRYVVSELVN